MAQPQGPGKMGWPWPDPALGQCSCSLLVVLVAEGGSWDAVSVKLLVVVHSGPGICGRGYSGVEKEIQGPETCLRPLYS